MTTRATDIVTLLRPRQWTKNLVVFAAVIFSGKLADPRAVALSVLAFVTFCFISSAVYAFNDVFDAEKDRRHPHKSSRPVASGRVSESVAVAMGAALALVGAALAWAGGIGLMIGVGMYLAVQVLYVFWLKNMVILDIMAIAAGFIIRAVTGALVIAVPISPWLIMCAGLLALFLAAEKRRHELVLLQGESDAHRPVLAEYSPELLDILTATLSAATITSYSLYTFFALPNAQKQSYLMMLTIPFVLYGLLRYQYLVLRKGAGGKPEEVLLTDVPTLVNVGLWMVAVVAIHYVLR